MLQEEIGIQMLIHLEIAMETLETISQEPMLKQNNQETTTPEVTATKEEMNWRNLVKIALEIIRQICLKEATTQLVSKHLEETLVQKTLRQVVLIQEIFLRLEVTVVEMKTQEVILEELNFQSLAHISKHRNYSVFFFLCKK